LEIVLTSRCRGNILTDVVIPEKVHGYFLAFGPSFSPSKIIGGIDIEMLLEFFVSDGVGKIGDQ
jgi:hypothetical protein